MFFLALQNIVVLSEDLCSIFKTSSKMFFCGYANIQIEIKNC